MVVENLPGASGMRGAETAVRAEPDGYTLLLSSAGEAAVNPHLFKNNKYDPSRDLTPVTLVVKVPNVLVVNAGGLPPKPKGMRWATYERWVAKHNAAEEMVDTQLVMAAARLMKRL